MIQTRRSWLALLAAGAFSPSRSLRASDVCDPSGYQFPPATTQSGPREIATRFKWERLECRPRPIWSHMSDTEKAAYKQKLKLAYHRLNRRRDRLGNTAGQGWLHNRACMAANPSVHSTSAFLPWHRAFLFFHERLLQAELRDPNFRLSVWNWEANSNIPEIYSNWIQIPNETGICSRDSDLQSIDPCMLQAWLLSDTFREFAGTPSGYPTGRASSGIHALVHMNTGGFMGDLDIAALDPLFYAHHGNVDRFWCAWMQKYSSTNWYMQQAQWPTQKFLFFDPRQGLVTVTLDQFMDTRALGYMYEQPAKFPGFEFTANGLAVKETRLQFDDANLQSLIQSLINIAHQKHIDTPTLASTISSARSNTELMKLAELTLKEILTHSSDLGRIAIPGVIEFCTDDIKPGEYYYIAVWGSESDPPPPAIIGGFEIFDHVQHTHHLIYLTASTCLKLADLLRLWPLIVNGTAQLVYGFPSEDESSIVDPKPIKVVPRFELRYPKEKDVQTFLDTFI